MVIDVNITLGVGGIGGKDAEELLGLYECHEGPHRFGMSIANGAHEIEVSKNSVILRIQPLAKV